MVISETNIIIRRDVINACACVCFVLVQFLDEPSGKMAEVMPDGSVVLIDVT